VVGREIHSAEAYLDPCLSCGGDWQFATLGFAGYAPIEPTQLTTPTQPNPTQLKSIEIREKGVCKCKLFYCNEQPPLHIARPKCISYPKKSVRISKAPSVVANSIQQLDKLVISQLGLLAQRRLARGVKLNHSEACVSWCDSPAKSRADPSNRL
jgi:Urease, gamma subunit